MTFWRSAREILVNSNQVLDQQRRQNLQSTSAAAQGYGRHVLPSEPSFIPFMLTCIPPETRSSKDQGRSVCLCPPSRSFRSLLLFCSCYLPTTPLSHHALLSIVPAHACIRLNDISVPSGSPCLLRYRIHANGVVLAGRVREATLGLIILLKVDKSGKYDSARQRRLGTSEAHLDRRCRIHIAIIAVYSILF
jgi:hypothetical protein